MNRSSVTLKLALGETARAPSFRIVGGEGETESP